MSEKSGVIELVKIGGDWQRIRLLGGYYRVLSGALKPTDLYYVPCDVRSGKPAWRAVGADNPLEPSTLDEFLLVIRKGMAVDVPCSKCKARAAIESDTLVVLCQDCLEKHQKA